MKHKKLISLDEAIDVLNALSAIDPAVDPFLSKEVREAAYSLENFDLESGKSPVTELAQDCFRSVLTYLQEMTKGESSYTMGDEAREEIKSIMLLAGDAAKKMDAYVTAAEGKTGKILQLPEFRELQELYQSKIDKPVVTQEKMGRWVLAIGKLPFPDFTPRIYRPTTPTSINPQRVYIDLDEVRSDSDYELFFIRKESGDRFFNPRLIRNMHLITEFGIQEPQIEPQFLPLEEWNATIAHDVALNLVRKGGSTFDLFTSERGKFKEKDLQNDLSKALMALLLASQGRFLHHQKPTKTCFDFFQDFMDFFRDSVRSYDYQKLISYPPRESNRLGHLLLSLVHMVARIIFFETQGVMACKPIVNQLLAQGYKREPGLREEDLTLDLGATLESDAQAIGSALKLYGNSPLRKTLDEVENMNEMGFDPYFQNNWPHRYMDLVVGNEEIHFIRLPCPTIQKSIDHPYVIEEFKAALRGLKARDKHAKVLVVNFQNRISWKENKRCLILEDLNDKEEWGDMVSVVTLESDTEFFNQEPPFNEESSFKVFKEQLREHLIENHDSVFLPEPIFEQIKEKEIDEMIKEVHQVFFGGANQLTKEQRVAFIDLTYQFFILKMIDLMHPRVVAFTCKDGIDLSNLFFAELYASLLLFNDRSIGETERDILNTILFAPAILFRERAPSEERLARVIETLKVIEEARKKKGGPVFRDTILVRLGRLYEHPLLESQWFV